MKQELKRLKGKASIVWNKILSQINKIYRSEYTSKMIYLCAGVALTVTTQIIIDFAQQYFHAKELSYEILSISQHKKYKLIDVAKLEGLDPFDLNLDDPILTRYYLIKIRLQNEGEAVKGTLTFHVSMGQHTKILDIKYKVISPPSKFLKIIHSLPPLTWKMLGKNETPLLSWDYDSPYSVAGFNVYRSVFKDIGYGRINEQLVTQEGFVIPFTRPYVSTSYYRITAVGTNGFESPPSVPDKFPDALAFQPSFKDVYFVDPNLLVKAEADGSRKAPFHSLTEAISKKGGSAIFIVNESRKNITSSQNISTQAKVFYKDDLGFLNGRAEVSLLNGIDEHADIELFFLCKSISRKEIDVKLSLEGAPQVKFGKVETGYENTVRLNQETGGPKVDAKMLLTPKKVKTFLGQNTIYLVWDKPQSPEYEGVRIFRSRMRTADDLTSVGEELHDGPGSTDTLSCKYSSNWKDPLKQHDFNRLSRLTHYHYQPPPRKGEGAPPAAPSRLRIVTTIDVNVDSFYYADKSVSLGMAYTYTLFAFDNENKYSYPILINASLNDWSPEIDCSSNAG